MVDVAGAKRYLTGIVSALESPTEVKRVHAYLGAMKVKGSLLEYAVDASQAGNALKVLRNEWRQSEHDGAVTMDVLMATRANQSEQTLRLVAEFRGSRDGTVLDRLDLRREP